MFKFHRGLIIAAIISFVLTALKFSGINIPIIAICAPVILVYCHFIVYFIIEVIKQH